MRKILTLTLAIFLLGNARLVTAQEMSKRVRQLVEERQKTTDNAQKGKLFEELCKISPKTEADVNDLIQSAKAAGKNAEQKETTLMILQRITEADKHLGNTFIKALDDSDIDIRIIAIKNLRKLKDDKALPKMRETLKGYGGFDKVKVKTMSLIDKEKAAKIVEESYEAALFLAEKKDKEGFDILVKKIDLFEGAAVEPLAKYGKMAIPKIKELTRDKEMGQIGYNAFMKIRDKEAEDDLVKLFMDDKEKDIRGPVCYALTGVDGDKIIDEIEKVIKSGNYDQDLLSASMGMCFTRAKKNPKAKEIYLYVIKNLNTLIKDKQRIPSFKAAKILDLGEIGDASDIPIFEEALKDEDSLVREAAADGLIVTGKMEDFLRLQKAVDEGLTVGNYSSQRRLKKILKNRIRTGKQGPITADDRKEQ